MPGAGLQPARPCGQGILSPLRLAVSPPGRPQAFCHVERKARRESESNRRPRLCRPLHDHSAIPPKQRGKARCGRLRHLPSRIWSGKRVSNSRPQPWQGDPATAQQQATTNYIRVLLGVVASWLVRILHKPKFAGGEKRKTAATQSRATSAQNARNPLRCYPCPTPSRSVEMAPGKPWWRGVSSGETGRGSPARSGGVERLTFRERGGEQRAAGADGRPSCGRRSDQGLGGHRLSLWHGFK